VHERFHYRGCFSEAEIKVREGAFGRDLIHWYTGIRAVSPALVLIMEKFKELTHVPMTVNISKGVQKKQSWRIITGRTII